MKSTRETECPGSDKESLAECFIIPFDRNERFTGRDQLLQSLRTMLCEIVPTQVNHRVALYGMGGVGKTQTAIAYVYANQTKYDKIYWISAATEASLFSGFQDIASRTRCVTVAADSDPKKVAKLVLGWLRKQDKWLVIIDNLDQIEIAKDYLPDRGPNKHTLITTRNPRAKGIPARGLEVPLPDPRESIEMLCILSDMDIISNDDHAKSVVEELQYLPLAIDQAASYVSAVTGNFKVFLDHYRSRRADLHRWVDDGNRQYSHSIATTWCMSFDFLKNTEPKTARLLQLLSFLNPDGMLIEFIMSGKDALDIELRGIFDDNLKFAKTLLSLERLSLIKWSRERNVLSIHRLIQAVVADAMDEHDRTFWLSAVVEMCNLVFPKKVTNENRSLCRRYQNQVVGPLLSAVKLGTVEAAEQLLRVGDFMNDDGKYKNAEQLLLQSTKIYSAQMGNEHPSTLIAR
jgi:hypothetical protein